MCQMPSSLYLCTNMRLRGFIYLRGEIHMTLGQTPWAKLFTCRNSGTSGLRDLGVSTTIHKIPLEIQTHGQLNYGGYQRLSTCTEIYGFTRYFGTPHFGIFTRSNMQFSRTHELMNSNLQIRRLALTSNQGFIFTLLSRL
jgi:hypothetical protein